MKTTGKTFNNQKGADKRQGKGDKKRIQSKQDNKEE